MNFKTFLSEANSLNNKLKYYSEHDRDHFLQFLHQSFQYPDLYNKVKRIFDENGHIYLVIKQTYSDITHHVFKDMLAVYWRNYQDIYIWGNTFLLNGKSECDDNIRLGRNWNIHNAGKESENRVNIKLIYSDGNNYSIPRIDEFKRPEDELDQMEYAD